MLFPVCKLCENRLLTFWTLPLLELARCSDLPWSAWRARMTLMVLFQCKWLNCWDLKVATCVCFPTSDWVNMKVEHELSKLIQKFPPSVNCMIIDCLFGGCYHIINLIIILDWLSGHWACHVDARPAAQTHPQARIIIAFDLDVGALDLSFRNWASGPASFLIRN